MDGRKCSMLQTIAVAVVLLTSAVVPMVDAQLSVSFYDSKCSINVTAKVASIVKSWIAQDRTQAPSLLRLAFHDCFVRGCDASVLLDSTSAGAGEKQAFGNVNSLRGYNIIDDIKTQLEAACPNLVSCADIIQLAARDALLAFNNFGWTVPLGRRDGVIGLASEANSNLPAPTSSFQQLTQIFGSKGFTVKEMVTLSGSHTIGIAHCSTINSRLYHFSSTTPTDPSLDPTFVPLLKKECRDGDTVSVVKMDQTKSVDTWDFNYYSNVLRGRGLLTSDAVIRTDPTGSTIAKSYNKAGSPFNRDFAAAMLKLGQVGVLTGSQGQIRKKCSVKN